MEYHGTGSDDIIDQKELGLPDWTTIFGEAGNDTIRIGSTGAVGGAGNDTIIGSTPWSAAVYWTSPTGIRVNLAAGKVEDGFGGIDTLVNVHVVHATGHSDILTGSAGDDEFWGLGGSDTVTGGGGSDQFVYHGVKSTDASISYDAATDTFYVVKSFPNGDRGTDTLQGVHSILFTGDGSDGALLTRDHFVATGGFRSMREGFTIPFPANTGLSQVKDGDFNGDGKADLYIAIQAGSGTALAPLFLFQGDGAGHFADATATLFPTAPHMIVGGGRALVADFNRDGASDIFQLDFGDDAPPFPGGLNHLFLSVPGAGTIADASGSLTQPTALNHGGSVGDVNGDGYPDVVSNTLDEGNILYLNDGTGHFVTRTDLLPRATYEAYGQVWPYTNTASGIADLNGDGFADLVIGRWDADSSSTDTQLLLNDGTGDFTKAAPLVLPATGLANAIVLDVRTIDLNGDLLPDLMLSATTGGVGSAYYTTPYIQLLTNQGSGVFVDETAARLPADLQATFGNGWFMFLESVDFNHDGHADILASSAGSISSQVLLNRGDGTFAPDWASAKDGRAVAADVNGDGMEDIVTLRGPAGTVTMNELPNGHIYRANFGGDTLSGSADDDTFYSGNGDDVLSGGAGRDLVRYRGASDHFTISRTASGFEVIDTSRAEGHDILSGIEHLVFADLNVALDLHGTAAQAYRLYRAAFDRPADLAGLGFWIKAIDSGTSLLQVAEGFLASAEFNELYGADRTNASVLTGIYRNVLHRAPDSGGFDFWMNALEQGHTNIANMLVAFSDSSENHAQVIGSIQNGIEYVPFGGG